ncbi:MAG: SusC/RagA family TonB-linked outer membrane protein [Bacteroidales bacterium]|nr:SusC/RagA family TonB-linked outer membrane protein [Bacteroidales bacterium]
MSKNRITIGIFSLFLFLSGTIFPLVAGAQQKTDSVSVSYPFGREVSDNFTTGSIRSVGGEALEEMPIGDIRGRLTGQLPGFMARELSGEYWGGSNYNSGVLSNNGWAYYLKGRSSLQLIVDDIRMPFTSLLLDPSQIESISLMSDVADKARLGAIASQGAVYIETRSGAYDTPMKVVASVESGLAMIALLPEWADGYQYAGLNNRARASSGYSQLYDPFALEGMKKNDPNDLIAPNVDYKGLMLRSWKPVLQESVRVTGGTPTIRYNATLSALHGGDIVNAGDISYNRINVSAGLGAKMNRWIELNLNYNGSINFNRQAYTSWNSYNSVPPTAFPLEFGSALSEEEIDLGLYGATRYGVSKMFENNYYALLKEGGRRTTRRRTAHINAAVNADLGFLLPGLKSRTAFSYLSFVSTEIGKQNDYLAYYWDASADEGYGQISTSHRGTKSTAKSLISSATNMALQFYERLYWDYDRNGHKINAGGTFLMYNSEGSGISYRQRQMLGVVDATWAYRNKYILEAVGQYVGSHRFNKANRFAFMPSFGASWIASNEDFLKDAGFLDKLKIRAQWGLVGMSSSVFGEPYYYQSRYSSASSYSFGPYLSGDTWFGTNTWASQATTIGRFENSSLGWPKERMLNIGIDAGLLDCINLSVDVFSHKQKGIITDIASALPALYGLTGIETYGNYNETGIAGIEFSAAYQGRTGDFSYGIALSGVSYKTEYKVLADNVFSEPWQDMIGTSTSAIWGYECLGRYENEGQLALLPAYSSDIAVGDLYYKDKNEDGVVDSNDRCIIGDSNPDVRFFVNLNFGWKRLNLQVIGTGAVGGDLALTNNYFWNGWGDGNYSAFVRDNIGGAYPRLSYVKSGNNFITSSFWLTDGSYFKIKDVILSYAFPKATVYLKGQNMCTLTKVKYVDPENIDSGISDYPMFRTVTLGVRMTF